tara:strand:- start:4256 stop:4765 length:510 start_codon:yes stop_codon:yes gene_type:complete
MHAIHLTPDDTARLRVLRAAALVTDPWSFGPTPGEDNFESEDRASQILANPNHAIFGVQDAADPARPLVAMAGVMRLTRAKQNHIADIWGVYTTQAFRRRGCCRALMHACIDQARAWPGVERITLSVSERSPGVRALYESLGFTTWGIEPDAVRIGTESAAERFMHMKL